MATLSTYIPAASRRIRLLVAVVLSIGAVAAVMPAAHASGTGGSVSSDDPRVQDAREYALDQGVELPEALRKLDLQRAAGQLEAELAEHERASFAGLSIEHSPQFRIVVRLKQGGPERIERFVAGGPLAGLVEVRPAQRSLVELEAAQHAARSATRALDVPVDSGINVRENRVELYARDKDRLTDALGRSGRVLPAAASVIVPQQLAEPEANLYAGLGLTACTSGFSVRQVVMILGVAASTGVQGITTAAHCGNTQSFGGSQLSFRAEVYSGPRDVQWHTTLNHTIRNWAFDGLSDTTTPNYRQITATKSRTDQIVGAFVCKYGNTTGRTCGYISDKSYLPSYMAGATATYIRVHQDGVDLSSPGDSGGPWYNAGTAYGIHKAGLDNDALYMAINYVEALGLRVLTQ